MACFSRHLLINGLASSVGPRQFFTAHYVEKCWAFGPNCSYVQRLSLPTRYEGIRFHIASARCAFHRIYRARRVIPFITQFAH
jgi:hypothetical protein